MENGIPDSWKKDSYGNNVFTLNVKCPMPIKKTLPVESTAPFQFDNTKSGRKLL